MYDVFFIALLIFGYGVYRKTRAYGVNGRDVGRLLKNLGQPSLWLEGFGQKKILRTRFGGLMHGTMFYGIAALTIGTIAVGIDVDLVRPAGSILLYGSGYLFFEVALDVLGLAFILGTALALLRKIFSKPTHVGLDRFDISILLGMLYLGVTGFMLEGFRLALIPEPWGNFSPVGELLSKLFSAMGVTTNTTWLTFYQGFWWVHAVVEFGLIASIPFRKFFHVPACIPNMVLDKPKVKGRMSTPFNLMELDQQENPPEIALGFSIIAELSWQRRAMLDSCTNCGRCESVCPATAAGRDLSPRILVQELKSQVRYDRARDNKDLFESQVVREDEQWACTSCYACVQECPVSIRQLDFILELRRHLVSVNRIDEKKAMMLSNLARNQNPYGFNSSERAKWASAVTGVQTIIENPEAEYLYWVGCVCSFDERAQRVAKALCKIMQKARLSFAILGTEELCNGDPARRLGEEGRFQELAFANIQNFDKHKIKKVVTTCPHCFNTLKNEYPVLGSKVEEVLHHSQLIVKLVREERIKVSKKLQDEITFHDACYMGRYNDVYNEPREALHAASAHDITEMHRNRDKGFCCGAGGSNYWYKVPQQKSISGIRYDEALATNAKVLGTECPFCLSMFEDASRVRPENCMKIMDIAEIVSENLLD
jgi:Fe-S oxidoreductase